MKAKKLQTLLSVLLLVVGTLNAQQLINPPSTEKCGFDYAHQNLMATDKIYKQKTIEYNQALETARQGNDAVQTGTVYRVPVVVHVACTG